MRRRNASRWVCGRAAAWLAIATSVGCKAHPEGITDLIGDGFSYVEFPGQRVLDAAVTRYGTDRTSDGSFVALGITDAGDLVIGDLAGGSYCTVGAATDFRPSFAYVGSNPTATRMVPYLRDTDADGWGTLAFASHDCARQVESASNAKFLDLHYAGEYDPPQFLAQSRLDSAGAQGLFNLLICDPALAQNPCRVLAAIQDADHRTNKLWTIEAVEDDRCLVVRDQSLEVVATVGSEVTDFVLGPYGNSAAYVDPAGLHFGNATGGGTPDLVIDGCELVPVLSRSRDDWGFSYRSPCANGSLFLHSNELGQDFELAPGADSPVIAEVGDSDTKVALYLTDTAPLAEEVDATSRPGLAASFHSNYGQLAPSIVGRLAATTLGGNTILGPSGVWLGSLAWSFGSRVRVLSEFDGKSGTLVEWDIAQNVATPVAVGVSDFSWTWAIVQSGSNTSDFVETRRDGTTSTLVKDVTDQGQMYLDGCYLGSIDCFSSQLDNEPAERRAIMSDSGNDGGKLWLLSRKEGGTKLESPEFLDDSVHSRSFDFLFGGDAVVYLRNVDPDTGTGTLTTRFVRTMDAFQVGHVQSWWEIAGEYPGVMYTTRQGSKSGLWFAALR